MTDRRWAGAAQAPDGVAGVTAVICTDLAVLAVTPQGLRGFERIEGPRHAEPERA